MTLAPTLRTSVSYITGLEIDELCARLDIFGSNERKLDTNTHILVKYKNGAVGSYWCSQVAIGYDNSLTVASSAPRVPLNGARKIPIT